MAGFNSIAEVSETREYFEVRKGLNGIAARSNPGQYFEVRRGLNGIAGAIEQIRVQSVGVVDLLGNVDTFQISNASLEDIAGNTQSVPLTFNVNTWAANETNFVFGYFREDIRLNFDISGVSLQGNPFNISVTELIPQINVL